MFNALCQSVKVMQSVSCLIHCELKRKEAIVYIYEHYQSKVWIHFFNNFVVRNKTFHQGCQQHFESGGGTHLGGGSGGSPPENIERCRCNFQHSGALYHIGMVVW